MPKLGLIISVICVFGLGLGAAGWGFFHLLQTAEVPMCLQPMGKSESMTDKNQGSSGENGELTNQNGAVNGFYYVEVEVAGAVVNPGVYRFKCGQRVGAALQQAGGISKEADHNFVKSRMNLARRLTDEEKIYVPYQEETHADQLREEICSVKSGKPGLDQTDEANNNCVSINQAGGDELKDLPGIGEKRAAKITQNRPYASIDELVIEEVLSESLLSDIESKICL